MRKLLANARLRSDTYTVFPFASLRTPQPSHAELQAVHRDLLTEENLLYCSDPHGAHIIDYIPTQDPKAVFALQKDIVKTDWRQDLKHVEPHKDASAPAVDRMLHTHACTRTHAHTPTFSIECYDMINVPRAHIPSLIKPLLF